MNRYDLLFTSLFVYSSALSMYKTPESLSSLPCLIDLKEDEVIDKITQYLDTKKSIIDQINGIEKIYLKYINNYYSYRNSEFINLITSLREWIKTTKDSQQRLLLFQEACRSKKEVAFQLIIQACTDEIGFLISSSSFFGWNALHIAVSVQSYDMVKSILEYGVTTHQIENILMKQSINRKKTPYHLALEAACCTEGGQQILELVADYVDQYCPSVKLLECSNANTPCDSYLDAPQNKTNKITSAFFRNTH